MFQVRKANERGHANHGWLDTHYTFSFSNYFDPEHIQFRALRVMNEDVVQPGQGFPFHGHSDMEIITYVLEGSLEHRDSMGNGSVLRAGELQRMSAGSGIRHSEFNPSSSEAVHLYQIWLLPAKNGVQPSYEQQMFPAEERRGKLQLVASREASEGSMFLNQDAKVYLSTLDPGTEIVHPLEEGRHAWVQVMRGAVELNGLRLDTSDGAAVSAEALLSIRAEKPSELLVFDLS